MRIKILITFIILFALIKGPASSEELPVWELGIGAFGINMPDYRGSDERRLYGIPVPFAIYRGENLKLNRRGAILDFLRFKEIIKFNLSLSAGIPVNSDKNQAREGMEDLDPTFGIGPALLIKLFEKNEKRFTGHFKLPAQYVFATSFSEFRGLAWKILPSLEFNYRTKPSLGFRAGFGLGPIFASSSYHDYFYGVQSKDQTSSRSQYNARGGYSGSRIRMILQKQFLKYKFAIFGIYDNLNGSAIEDSPLVKTKHSYVFGLWAGWIFAQSDETVEVN